MCATSSAVYSSLIGSPDSVVKAFCRTGTFLQARSERRVLPGIRIGRRIRHVGIVLWVHLRSECSGWLLWSDQDGFWRRDSAKLY